MMYLISFDTAQILGNLRFRGPCQNTKWVCIHQTMNSCMRTKKAWNAVIGVPTKKAKVFDGDQWKQIQILIPYT